ncbi:MAG: hypothetical protein FJW80_03270 [Actinobacteria bacterium]|nr:hypothetical protein [Actinomycetota bacterium]
MTVVAPPESVRDPDRGGAAARASLAAAAIVIVGSVVFYLGMLLGSSSDVPANTTVLGVQIGGLSRAEAVATLDREVGPRALAPISVSAFDTTEEIFPSEAGLAFDPIATVDAAEGRLYNPLSMVLRLFGSTAVDPVVTVDEAALSARLQLFADLLTRPITEPTVHYEGMQPTLTSGQDGRTLDVPLGADQVADAYLLATDPVPLPEIVLPAAVSPEEAQAFVAGPATIAVAAPIAVQADTVTAQVPPEAIAEATHYIVEGEELAPQIDGAILYAPIAKDLGPISTPGNDATFQINADNVPVVVPSRVGAGVSDEVLAAAVGNVLFEEGDARVALTPITVRDPKLTTEQAMQLGVVKEISSFTQQVNYAEYMAHNLALAAEYINGTLLMPGEVFSMNEKTENRDPENGYMEGYVIGPGGIFTRALGGGLSAATTTMWSTAFYAGLEPVEVQAHSIYISRYVPGLEATVAWEGFDMKFRNNTPYGVFITASTTDTSMTVTMYSTRIYTKVDAEVGDRYGITPSRKIYSDSPQCLAQSGGEGFTIDVDRVFYQGATEVNRETFTTTYSPAPQVVCGKKPDKDKDKDDDAGGGSESPAPEPTDVPAPEPTDVPAPEPTDSQTASSPS